MTDQLSRVTAALANRYRVEREIGGGGMATVYLAEDLKHHRHVAVKVLRPDLAAALGPERFLREIEIAAQLQHPNILPLLDSGEAGGFLYYVMPFIEGRSLRAKLVREGELPIDEAVRILRDVVDALTEAHAHGVVHRDIKPENILISGRHALVTDFGVAKAVSEATGTQHLTTAGVALGTPAYMAPEQAAADPHLDHRVDLYAVGAVAYELLTGRPVFTGTTPQMVLSAHVTEPPEPVTKHRETVPEPLAQVVMRCLEKKPADRFQSADELLPLLEALATPSGGITPTAMQPVRAPRLARRRTNFVLAGAAVVVALAAIIILGRLGTGVTLDPNLVAVAPFDILDPDLELWREGLVDVLSASMDGAGPLRAVPPSVVVRQWSGRADEVSAADLGARVGAGLALYGRIVGAGADSVRLSATLLDVERGSVVVEIADLRGRADRIDLLADTLAVRLVGHLSETRPMAAVRHSSLGSQSPTALKEFLQAEQHYRRSNWDSAQPHYERAIAADSTFALAFARLGWVLGWQTLEAGAPFQLRAGALNRGLAARESLLVAADSVSAALLEFDGDSSDWALLPRLFATLEAATARYPLDAQSWYRLGEARYHWGPFAGATDEELERLFSRAVELDSAFTPPYIHLIECRLRLHGLTAGQEAMASYLALNPRGISAEAVEVVSALLDPRRAALPETQQALRSASARVITQSRLPAYSFPDSAESSIRVGHAFAALTGDSGLLVATLAHRGHLREALVVMGDDQPLMFADIALLGGVPRDSAAPVFAAWHGRDAAVLALPWWAEMRDTTPFARFRQGVDSAVAAGSLTKAAGEFLRERADAYHALAGADSAGALQRFRRLPVWPAAWLYHDRLTLARLLVATGALTAAAAILDQIPYPLNSRVRPGEVLWILDRARVHERLGNAEKAQRAYAYVAEAWRHADPLLRPYADEAREALRRLARE